MTDNNGKIELTIWALTLVAVVAGIVIAIAGV